ncbi:ABC transporter G family member 28-like, partial [Raphanus sativus]|uniref:ABC transporter G family member 28-like n=1 Tax=Raphanus sativus TaxID=3726 RepID=A0A9W3DF14_RAPSA
TTTTTTKPIKEQCLVCCRKEDYNEAFNFSSKPGFLNACGKTTKGDMMQRICTAAEVRIYFNGLLGGAKRATNYLKPNKNCNLSSWMSGCEPGWACRTAKDVKVDLKDDKNVPVRTQQCAPCCAGFFCPRGITCCPCIFSIFSQGSVKKVEEYFSSLGIIVPERVNPPDYYIDILEGILKPSTSSGVTYKQLPVRWMLHNGYPVPSDMLKSIEGMASAENSAHGGSAHGSVVGDDGTSFAGEFWQDVKANVEIKKDTLQNNFSSSGDLSERQVPGVYQQYRYFLGGLGKQRLREARTLAVDYLILLLAGICLGTLAKVSDETFGAMGYTYTVIAVYYCIEIFLS